mgnify:CR=1 FL=1
MEFFEDHHVELYNLRDDPGESKNLAATRPEKVREFHDKLAAWRKKTGAKMPTPHEAGHKPKDFGRGKASGKE